MEKYVSNLLTQIELRPIPIYIVDNQAWNEIEHLY